MKNLLIISILLFAACSQNPASIELSENPPVPKLLATKTLEPINHRHYIEKSIQTKIQQKKPLQAYIVVPLCDNEHQGIVPTSASLGNGQNLKTNLYWATSGGMKNYFVKHPQWQLLSSFQPKDTCILERIVVQKLLNDSVQLRVVIDAFAGDKMEQAIHQFLATLSCNLDTLQLSDNQYLSVKNEVDLVGFNGHNGLMDGYQPKRCENRSPIQKDAAIMACFSNRYWDTLLVQAQAYPLLRCAETLYPAAYTWDVLLENWALSQPLDSLTIRAARYYCNKHICGEVQTLFKAGW